MDGDSGQGVRRPASVGTLVAALLAALVLTAAPAHAAVDGDFNGDGRSDLAIGAPGETLGAAAGAGQVTVLYALPGGRLNPGGQAFNQDTDGIPDTSEPEAGFGAQLAAGDFDGDGRADLAIGAPGESVGDAAGAGKVTVLRGSAAGLQPAGAQAFGEDVAGIDAAATGAGFGSALATGDFNGDGRDDLAVGAPGAGAGEVVVLYGSAVGLAPAGARTFGALAPGQLFGAALAAGDFNGDGVTDLAVGSPGDGSVAVLAGSPGGLQAASWTVSHAALGGEAPTGGSFGAALAAGDFNRDGAADLAVGAPGAHGAAGQVTVISGGAGRGLSAAGAQAFDEAAAGGPPAAGGDLFGATLTAGDFNRDGSSDLAVGAPGATVAGAGAAGRVGVLYGGAGGIGSSAAQGITQGPALHTNNDPGDEFGGALAGLDVAGAGGDYLVIGAPGENTNSSSGDALDGAGQLLVLRSGPRGLLVGGAQKLSQDGSVPDNSEGGDAFAFALG